MASEKHRDSPISTIVSEDLDTGARSSSQSAERQTSPLSETSAAVRHAVEPPSTISKLLTGWWYVEIACMILSFAVFGLYCWFLSSWEGYRVSDWNKRVPRIFSSFFIKNLGSAASLFITILKVLSFIPITASMGQLKWHYFLRRYSRPVAELETFDAASRSVSGSIKLLASGKRLHSIHITLGCLLTLATLYLGSSTQNTITSPSEVHWSPEGAINKSEIALVPVTEVFNVTTRSDILGVDNQNFSEDPGMQAALFTAWSVYQNPLFENQDVDPVSANCSSTYCRWYDTTTITLFWECRSAAATLGADGIGYSQEANITSRVEVDINGSPAPRKALLSLKASPEIPRGSGFNEAGYKSLGVIVHLAAIAQHDEQRFDAAECMVAWAAAHISETVFQNKSGTTMDYKGIATEPFPQNRTATEDNKDIIFQAPCNGKKDTDVCHFKVTSGAHLAVRRLLANFTTGFIYRDVDSTNNGTLFIPSNPVMNLFAWSWRTNLARVSQFPNPLNKTLHDYIQNTAWALSGYIRNKQGTQIEGKNGYFEPVFHIEWRYTIHPGVMLILTLYLLAFTVRATRDMPVWKSSLLPFLYHGFDHPILNSGCDLSGLPWMEGLSKEKRVVLRDAGDGLGLRLRDMERGTDDEGV